MKVKFKKLHEDSVLPTYAKEGDAGMDLTTVTDGEICEDYIKYEFGLAVEIPEGYVGLIFPRSSISKTDLSLSNAVGVIDSSFRLGIQARFNLNLSIDENVKNTYDKEFKLKEPPEGYISNKLLYKHEQIKVYKKGDRIAQMIIMPYPIIEPEWSEELSETDRGEGFGSTGN